MHLTSRLMIATFLWAGCGTSQPLGDEQESVDSSSAELVVRRPSIRNDSAAPVCFVGGTTVFRNLVRRAVERAWAGETGYTFSGWTSCPVFPPYGTIVVKDAISSHSLSNEVRLNFMTANSSHVVHEFGHAMGFLDEEAQSGVVSCPRPVDPSSIALGGFDTESTMKYCSSYGASGVLSKNDIAFANWSYGSPRSVAATSWGPGRIDAFVQETDGLSLWHFSSGNDGASWGAEQFFDGQLTSAPVAVSRGSGKLDILGRGPNGRILWKRYAVGQGWSGWSEVIDAPVTTGSLGVANIDSQTIAIVGRQQFATSDPGIFLLRVAENSEVGDFVGASGPGGAFPVGAPAVAVLANQIHVLTAMSDSTLVHFRFALSGLTFSVAPVPNFLVTGSPAMVATNGRLELVAKGLNGDLFASTFDPAGAGSWSAPLFLNGTLRGNPSIASWGPGRIDVFGRGLGDGVFHWSRNAGGSFSGPNSQGGSIYGSPTAVSSGSERITVLGASAVDESMVSQSWLGSSWTSLRSIGGSYLR